MESVTRLSGIVFEPVALKSVRMVEISSAHCSMALKLDRMLVRIRISRKVYVRIAHFVTSYVNEIFLLSL